MHPPRPSPERPEVAPLRVPFAAEREPRAAPSAPPVASRDAAPVRDATAPAPVATVEIRAPSTVAPLVARTVAPSPPAASVSDPPLDGPPDPEPARPLPREASPEGCATGECLTPPAPEAPLVDRWREAVAQVRAAAPRHGASLAAAKVLALGQGRARISFGPRALFHRATVMSETGRHLIEQTFSRHLGHKIQLVVEEHTDAPGFCLADAQQQQRTAHTQGTEQTVREHPALRSILRVLGGEVEHIQVLEKSAPLHAAPSTVPPYPPSEEER